MSTADFTFTNHGSVCVLTPHNDTARDWIDQNCQGDAQRWANGIVIEPRYADPILNALNDEGFVVRATTTTFH